MTAHNDFGAQVAPPRKYMKAKQCDKPMLREMESCFRFFLDNYSRESKTYGLMPDSIPNVKHVCSVASNGFMLAAMAVGVDFKWIDRAVAKTICDSALETLLALPQDHGFLYHFYNLTDGTRFRNCELSTIDSALLFCGALTAGAYFGSDTLKLARKLLCRAEWDWFYDPTCKHFFMARYDAGMRAHWDYYAEQLMIYVLAAANGAKCAREAYDNMGRLHGKTASGEDFIYTWFGSLFTHQFTHAFVDFQGKTDADGVDWFENSVKATQNDRLFCAAHPDLYPDGIWGLTSCAVPGGYKGHMGSTPSGNNNTENVSDGTVAPCAALGSIVFTPNESLQALNVFLSHAELMGKYGLYDSFNAVQRWHTECYIGIDKGITLLMGANHYKRTVWKYFDSLTEIRNAMRVLGIVPKQHNQGNCAQTGGTQIKK